MTTKGSTVSATDTEYQIFSMVTNPTKSKMEELQSAMLSDRNRLPRSQENDSENSDDDERKSEKSNTSRKSDKSDKSEKSTKSVPISKHNSDDDSGDEEAKKPKRSDYGETEKPKHSDDDSDDERNPKSVASAKSFYNSEARMSTNEMATRVSVPNSTYSRVSRNSRAYDSDDQSVLSDNNVRKRSVPPLAPLDNQSDVGSNVTGVSRLPNNKEQEILEKQSVLLDMERLKLQGIQFTKTWTLSDRLDDMQFEMRRHLLHLDEINNMNFLRDGLRMACTGFEVLNRRWGLLELDGWSQEVCRDMTRYDNSMSRLYRKYWRRTSTSSPEMELGLALMGSVGMYHFKQKMSSQMFSSGPSIPRTRNVPMQMPNSAVDVEESSDEDEGLPP